MRIKIDILKEIPKELGEGLCVFGESEMLKEWAKSNDIPFEKSKDGKFTNFDVNRVDLGSVFEIPKTYRYVDGFSPNLNKYLHVGHMSNLAIALALQGLGVGKEYIAILGDTLGGEVKREDAFQKYVEKCKEVGYKIDKVYYASQQTLKDSSLLIPGTGEYTGSQVFRSGENLVVGIKSNGDTSYFYQDVALAQHLQDSTLYLTGFEQKEHFENLKTLFPQIDHLPLGLLLLDGKKMSSSEGNVVFLSDFLLSLEKKFESKELAWNVAAGFILKSHPGSVKNFSLSHADKVKLSPGLYLSYTLARMKSAGIFPQENKSFHTWKMNFKFLKAKTLLQPNVLLEGCIELAKEISRLYEIHQIKGNSDASRIFLPLAEDLLQGMKILGMKEIEKV